MIDIKKWLPLYKALSLNSKLLHPCIVIAYYILFQLFYNLIDSKLLWPYESMHQFMVYFALNFIPIVITYIVNYVIVFSRPSTSTQSRKLTIDILFSFASMIVVNLLFLFVVSYIDEQLSRVNWAGTVFNNIFIFLGLEVTYFVKNHIKQIKEISLAKQKVLQYQYDALRSQVDPHFLFNTLNILYSLVAKDTEKSKAFILSLSRIYRFVLEQQGREKVALKDEISFVEEYTKILILRYNNNFSIKMNGNPSKLQYIIPFTLQLLVENAIKHNKISTQIPMCVTIDFKNDHLTVSNPINRKESLHSTQIGLKYLQKLYDVYERKIEISDDNKTFIVTIPFLY
ncbi:MAG: yehU 3 [Bacteroidetes bacterium]|nr:yehU 3 [Bacteroidota bacterium]MBP1677686.1 yehU 3 [Bacteroidota bacterium]